METPLEEATESFLTSYITFHATCVKRNILSTNEILKLFDMLSDIMMQIEHAKAEEDE